MNSASIKLRDISVIAEFIFCAFPANTAPALLDKLALELAAMYQAGVLFLDFHLENVLVDAQGELWWIDAEFTYNRRKVKGLFWARMQRMHDKCDPNVLSLDEWEHFCQQLRQSGC